MRLVDYLDKGASLGADAPCLLCDGETWTYADVVATSHRVAGALVARGAVQGDKVAILSANDPLAFACVFGISRAGAVWCPINPRNEAGENRELLELFECSVLIFQASFAPLVDAIRGDLPGLGTLVCLDGDVPWALGWAEFLSSGGLDTPPPSGSGSSTSERRWSSASAGGSRGSSASASERIETPDKGRWSSASASEGRRSGGLDTPPPSGSGYSTSEGAGGSRWSSASASERIETTDKGRWSSASASERTETPDDLAMIVGTGGTTGRPKGVMLTGTNLETMTAITLMSYPWPDPPARPAYLALAPLTHAAGVLCFPVLCLGGSIVVMRTPDVGAFLGLVAEHRVTHTFLPPTLIYMVLDHPALDTTDLSSLQCFWYGAAPMSTTRLEEALSRIGPVMAQLFGQTEAPMMISTLAPGDHFRPDGSVAHERLSSAGRPSPLTTVTIMAEDGTPVPAGERGEIVVRGSLVMRGYYRNEAATAEASAYGWHHTGDIGFLDADGFLHIVDRAKDMVITGGFNVYSTEVEQALMQHPAVAEAAVVGLPDDKWGERVTAVLQLRPGLALDPGELTTFVKERIGSVKTPKQIEVWPDLPRSKVGKVLKTEIKRTLTDRPVRADGMTGRA